MSRWSSLALAIAGAAVLCAPVDGLSAKPKTSTDGSTSNNSGKGNPPGNPNGGGNPAASVTVTKDQDLRFGKLVMTSSTGVVVVPAMGLPNYQGAVSIDGASSVGPARFEIKGPPNHSIELDLTFPLSGSYGQNGTAKLDRLSVSADYTTGFSQNGTLVRVKLDGSGNNVITVGGTLTFARDNAYGAMNILFPISAAIVQ